MSQRAQASLNAYARWTSRVIPVCLAAIAGYGTYVIIGRLCIQFLYQERNESGVVVAFLILYFIPFIMSVWAYIRTVWVINTDAGLVPLSPDMQNDADRTRRQKDRLKRMNNRQKQGDDIDLESQAYPAGDGREQHQDPDSPGLEQFYTKDVFVCESDGRPKWCSECRNWKPDRAHHSSELGRCVRKMDHYCPWVGGMVSETSFKFFCQFTFYCTGYCAIALAISAYCVHLQTQDRFGVDRQAIAAVAISSFFILFTSGMTLSSVRFVFKNITNIDSLKKAWVHQLAVRVPLDTPPQPLYTVVNYPLPKPPLQAPAPSHQPNGQINGHVSGLANGQANGNTFDQSRDRRARRTFAVVRTEHDENPWDLGWRENFKEVMGTNVIDWLLPIRRSPCCFHGNPSSDYPMGPLLSVLRERFNLEEAPEDEDRKLESKEARRKRRPRPRSQGRTT